MSDDKKVKPWTDTEKTGLFIQIIERFGTIPWEDLTLPDGRTKKACSVMVDKEKQKVKKARAAAGGGTEGGEMEEDDAATPKAKATPKRKAAGEAGSKKAKTPRKTKAQAGENEIAGESDEIVKAEMESESDGA